MQLVVDAFVQYRIAIPELAAFKVESVENLIKYMTQGTLKTVFCEHSLSELLTNRKMIEKKLREIIDPLTDIYGVQVLKIGTKQIKLPRTLQESMATIAVSEKQKEAKIIDAEANLDSAVLFREAADEICKNRFTLQLQYHEILKFVSTKKDSIIVVSDSVTDHMYA